MLWDKVKIFELINLFMGVLKMVNKERIEIIVREFLKAIGENPERDGLKETPTRVARMCEELFKGICLSPKEEIRIFNEQCIGDNRDYVILKDIPVYSICEHHLMPFIGHACIVYIPKEGKVIGLSKIARIIDLVSKKPQLQERLTNEIADILYDNIEPKGLAVFIIAEHLCVSMRGVKAIGTKTQTSSFRGVFEESLSIRAEILNFI